MSQFITVSKFELQELPEKTRMDNIRNVAQQYHHLIIRDASYGKTSYLVDYKPYDPKCGVGQWPPPFIPTKEDLIEGFKLKFPGCRVEYTEIWQETKPGVKQLKTGILIDWS